jgi:hypothetical protein
MLIIAGLSELKQVPVNSSSKPEQVNRNRAISFEEFRKAKQTSRRTTLPSSGSSSTLKKDKSLNSIKHYQEDVSLKSLKGRTLPLTVDPDIDANHLLNEAVTKHSKHICCVGVMYSGE